jgi:hypothetical protein
VDQRHCERELGFDRERRLVRRHPVCEARSPSIPPFRSARTRTSASSRVAADSAPPVSSTSRSSAIHR